MKGPTVLGNNTCLDGPRNRVRLSSLIQNSERWPFSTFTARQTFCGANNIFRVVGTLRFCLFASVEPRTPDQPENAAQMGRTSVLLQHNSHLIEEIHKSIPCAHVRLQAAVHNETKSPLPKYLPSLVMFTDQYCSHIHVSLLI